MPATRRSFCCTAVITERLGQAIPLSNDRLTFKTVLYIILSSNAFSNLRSVLVRFLDFLFLLRFLDLDLF